MSVTINITPKLVDLANLIADDYSKSTGADDPAYYIKYYLDVIPHLGTQEAVNQMMGWELGNGKTWVELGSGIGTKCVLMKALYGGNIIGIEPYPNTYSQLKAAIDELQEANPQYHYTSLNDFGENLSLEDNSVDMLVSHEVMEHVQDLDKVIAEIYRVLKPGGQAFIATCNYASFYDGHYRTFFPPMVGRPVKKLWIRLRGFNPKFINELYFVTKKQLRGLAQEVGFKDITFFPQLNYRSELPQVDVNFPEGFEFKVPQRGWQTFMQRFIQKPKVVNFLRKFDREYKVYIGVTK